MKINLYQSMTVQKFYPQWLLNRNYKPKFKIYIYPEKIINCMQESQDFVKTPKWYVFIDSTINETMKVVSGLSSALKKDPQCDIEIFTTPNQERINETFLGIIGEKIHKDSNPKLMEKIYLLYICQQTKNNDNSLRIIRRAYNSFENIAIQKFCGKEHYLDSMIELKRITKVEVEKVLDERQNKFYYQLQEVAYKLGFVAITVICGDTNNIKSNIEELLGQLE